MLRRVSSALTSSHLCPLQFCLCVMDSKAEAAATQSSRPGINFGTWQLLVMTAGHCDSAILGDDYDFMIYIHQNGNTSAWSRKHELFSHGVREPSRIC